jgi:hypothetical protein
MNHISWGVLAHASRLIAVATFVALISSGGIPSVAHAVACNDGAVKPGSGSDWYECHGGSWQYYPPPTFDPNSGDGYGPNQPFPPACIRFKQPCPQ